MIAAPKNIFVHFSKLTIVPKYRGPQSQNCFVSISKTFILYHYCFQCPGGSSHSRNPKTVEKCCSGKELCLHTSQSQEKKTVQWVSAAMLSLRHLILFSHALGDFIRVKIFTKLTKSTIFSFVYITIVSIIRISGFHFYYHLFSTLLYPKTLKL